MSEFISLNSIIGNGKSYKIPIYQRDYSWDKDDWEDLWNDLLDIPQGGYHYLGYLVLQPVNRDDETYSVIDGQQRLTTISIIALAVTALLKKWSDTGIEIDANKLRYDEEIKRYLGNFSTSNLTISPKLTLNRNNDDYYRSWMMYLRQPNNLNKLNPSSRLLQRAFNYYYKQLEEKYKGNTSGAELTEFLEKKIGTGFVFTTIYVENDLDAFKVFETLNARGVKLSPADLLKNYLFSLCAKHGEMELNEADRRWNNIMDTLAKNDITTYIRHYWNSKFKLERQPTLFKAIKTNVQDAEKSFHLLDKLEKNAVYYTAFNNPGDDIWEKDERKYLQVLSLLEVTTCYSLMLAVLDGLDRQHFKTILKEIVIITFRYNISGLNPNEAERLFSDVANQINNNTLKEPKNISLALKPIYVQDNNFEQAFATTSISTRRKKELVKYILVKLENQISGNDYQYEDATATIEHILPENPGSAWEERFPIDIQDEYIYRLGNYTLLQASVNNKLDNNAPFQTKLEMYLKSNYRLSSEYCLYDDFTPTTLNKRQERMAKLATAVWRSVYI